MIREMDFLNEEFDVDNPSPEVPTPTPGTSSPPSPTATASSQPQPSATNLLPKKTVQVQLTSYFGGTTSTASRNNNVSRDTNYEENENGNIEKEDESQAGSVSGSNIAESHGVKVSQEDFKKICGPYAVIWNYFSKIDCSTAKCNSCSAICVTPTGTTIQMIRHLNKAHPSLNNEFNRLQKTKQDMKKVLKEKAKKAGSTSTKAVKSSILALDSKSKRAQSITRAIAIFICKGLHPYCVVDEVAFQHLMGILEPRYIIPHRTTFSRRIIPDMYEELKEKQQKKFHDMKNSLESVCITTDIWTSRSGDSFLAFTLQAIDSDFQFHSFTVECQPFPGRHDAAAICKAMEEVIKDNNLDSDFISKYVVSDNGANMIAALEQPSEFELEYLEMDTEITQILKKKRAWEHKKCFNHTAQLAINDTKREVGATSVLDKISNLVGRYSRSRIAQESLEKFQIEHKLPKHSLVQRVKTRWDSDFLMLERAVEQKAAITSELSAAGEENLTASEWKLAEGFVEVLRPVASHTADMGSGSGPTACMVLPTINEINGDLEEFIKKSPKGTGIMFARKLQKNLQTRFAYYQNDITYALATVMDPRYKDLFWDENIHSPVADVLKSKAEEKYRQHIRRGFINATSTSTSQAQVESVSDEDSQLHPPPSKKPKWKHLKKKTSKRNNPSVEDVSEKIKAEIDSYLSLPTVDEDQDPLLWWNTNKSIFPFLAPLAREYLAIGATETPSERVFSVGSNTVTCKRTNLLPEHVKEIIFCHDNLEVPSSSSNLFVLGGGETNG